MSLFDNPLRIALWSGPRNLSTAMMRSFSSRDDSICVDEPFYAAYLALTGLVHPMRDEILQAHENDPQRIIETIAYKPAKAPLYYQKHMCHHMIDDIDRGWMSEMRHAFLIRHPERVLASYAKKTQSVNLEAIGFQQQCEIFQHVTNDLGQAAIVIDSDDILQNPADMLLKLCSFLDIEYQDAMLTWPSGYHPEDGIWAKHWYKAVIESEGFGEPAGDLPKLPSEYAAIAEQAMPFYDIMTQHKIT